MSYRSDGGKINTVMILIFWANCVDLDQTAFKEEKIGQHLHCLPGCEGINLWKRTYEPHHDKINKMAVCPAKTQISMGIRPV